MVLSISTLILQSCTKHCVGLEPIAHQEVVDLATEINLIENNLMAESGASTRCNILHRMEEYNIPGVSIAVVEGGVLKWAKGYGLANTETGSEVNTNTLFQAASISKPLTALCALKLVDEGQVDLDGDVNSYLEGWSIPENDFTTTEKVTLRRLLSHTAGTTVHGFGGYKQTETFPSIEMVLNGEGNSPAIEVDEVPGSIWRYSGGGYTVMEKVVEDVSGLPLESHFTEVVSTPLNMTNSLLSQPLPEQFHDNASAAYNPRGKIVKGFWHNYPEQAAAGLWTTPTDLAKYCIEIHEIFKGKSDGILSPETVELMLTNHKDDFGLGLFLTETEDETIFHHAGNNVGFTNQMVAFANSGNAVVILTNAEKGMLLIDEILRGMEDFYGWGLL
ncbi:MAG: serine hydrolase domain-containing protein [Saprospiraceae bacterium]